MVTPLTCIISPLLSSLAQLQSWLLESERHQPSTRWGGRYYGADGGDGQSGQIKREIKKGQVRAGRRGWGEGIEAVQFSECGQQEAALSLPMITHLTHIWMVRRPLRRPVLTPP